MFVAIYRWKVVPELEERFECAWSRITSMYTDQWRSDGSALFGAHDCVYVGMARWQTARLAASIRSGP